MSIGKLLSREAAARKIMAATRDWWERRGETVLRHSVEVCLVIALAITFWSLVRPWLPGKLSARAASQNPISTARVSAMSQAQPSDTNRLAQTHLFGIAKPAQVSLAADPTIQVNGIAYSSDADQSLAILSLNGTALVAHKGTVLPDGSTVLTVASDRVTVSRNGQVENLMLDLKKAAVNAHFAPAQFATGSTAAGDFANETSDINQREQVSGTVPAAFPATPGERRPRLELPHFESLRQLRGGRKIQRFQKIKPPGI